MDTGIDAYHPDLRSRVDRSLFRCFNPDYVSLSVYRDLINHGTPAAGIIGAIAPNAKLVSLRIFRWFPEYRRYRSPLNAQLDAIRFATTNRIRVLNMSFGGGYNSEDRYNAIRMFPGVVVVSAGNSINNNDINPTFPASHRLPNLISVGSSDSNDRLSIWNALEGSNFGSNTVDVFAPGTNVSAPRSGGGWSSVNGTSISAPFVAGTAALMMGQTFFLAYHPRDIRDIIIATVDTNAHVHITYNSVAGGILCAFSAVARILQTITGLDREYVTIIIPYINASMFRHNTSLRHLTFSTMPTYISNHAFFGVINLYSINATISGNPPRINNTTFFGLARANIRVIVEVGATQHWIDAGWIGFRIIERGQEHLSTWHQPLFTSNTSHGTITASGVNDNEQPWRAFNGTLYGGSGGNGDNWSERATEGWLQLRLDYYIIVHSIEFINGVSTRSNRTRDAHFTGSAGRSLGSAFTAPNRDHSRVLVNVGGVRTNVIRLNVTRSHGNYINASLITIHATVCPLPIWQQPTWTSEVNEFGTVAVSGNTVGNYGWNVFNGGTTVASGQWVKNASSGWIELRLNHFITVHSIEIFASNVTGFRKTGIVRGMNEILLGNQSPLLSRTIIDVGGVRTNIIRLDISVARTGLFAVGNARIAISGVVINATH